ncbi:LysM peptidoglycan-binding domain-containing protein [Ligilactobacillus pobuzihii]|uniref:aggregation-promoting factor n=1 Tax=Ligilactobacillus pobuzihii TaxID=449659 RepID=UPI0019D30A8F|nr:LysM peptidoglycan-binding domain-containing protein [Ligilactobacillus pobuzihii]MBN7274490.1 LysM peptidoglycan-binding domain-containing protein [Ligilactobacillus pobuzihii]
MNQTVKNVALGSVGAAGLFLASGAVTNASEVHTVSSNDTVWALAQKYGVSQDSIEKQNNIDPQTHIIYQGQKLTINSDSTQSQPKPKTKTNGSYTVKAGDSLWTIAQSAGISVAQLRQTNGLDLNSSVIQPGQSLNLTVSKQASQVTVDTNVNASASTNAQVSSTPQVSEQSEPTKTLKQQSVSAQSSASSASEVEAPENKTPETTSEVKNSTDEVNTESSVAQASEANNSATKSATDQEQPQVSKQTESASSTTETQQPVERKAATNNIKQQTVSQQNVSKPVQKKVVQPKAQQPTVSQKSTISTQTTAPKQNVPTSEVAAKEWIAQKESGGSYTAKNGQYYGRYQLTDAYLNHDYSAANQEKVANAYVTSAYGSWNDAKTFWLQNGWY